jgi:DNA-binding transcriptional ArsR family regulator
MIQAILTYEFVLKELDTGEVEPEFNPLHLEFNNEKFSESDYSSLITRSGLFSVYYQHTTTTHEISGEYSNFYSGRLKENPYQVMSYFKQMPDESQFITLCIFSLNDELVIFEKLIKSMATRLDEILRSLNRARSAKQLSVLENINQKLKNELKFTIFQIERLSSLDKLQKAALIFNNQSRLKILRTLRERPVSKSEMREILENIKENPNVDLLLEPFLELNLVKRDWIKGKRDKKTGIVKSQGEYLFLTKDIDLIRVPNKELLEHLEEFNEELYRKYNKRAVEFFSNYDPTEQTLEETRELASLLLDPDIYDNFVLMRNKFYPVDKIPKIFSEFADIKSILTRLKELNIVIEIDDAEDRTWLLLLSDIKPIIFFPEYLLPKIKQAVNSEKVEEKITSEIAKKAFDLLEVAYPEKVEF